jgi:hypothetical protein
MTNSSPNSVHHLPQIVQTLQPPPGQPPAAEPVVSLSTPQELALEWLIGGGSIAEAAQFAAVSRQTISRWMRTDPDFRAVYEAWKIESQQMLEGRLIAAADAAMDNLLNAVRTRGNVTASQFVIRTLLNQKKARLG